MSAEWEKSWVCQSTRERKQKDRSCQLLEEGHPRGTEGLSLELQERASSQPSRAHLSFPSLTRSLLLALILTKDSIQHYVCSPNCVFKVIFWDDWDLEGFQLRDEALEDEEEGGTSGGMRKRDAKSEKWT